MSVLISFFSFFFYCYFSFHRTADPDEHGMVTEASVPGNDDTIFAVEMARLKGKMKVKVVDDSEDCYISGMAVTAEGNFLLADFDNSKVKLFSPFGQLLSYLNMAEKPVDIAVIDNSEAAVSLTIPQICILNIDSRQQSELSLKQSIDLDHFVWGIAVYKNNLVISCDISNEAPRSIQMINRKGKILWTVTLDLLGNSLFDYARFLTTCVGADRDTVVVTDWDKATITVLDAHSGTVVKVCDVKDRTPRGVTVDKTGRVYVCFATGEISVWSKDMSSERCLIAKGEGVRYAHSLVFDSTHKELLVTSNSTNTVLCDCVHYCIKQSSD